MPQAETPGEPRPASSGLSTRAILIVAVLIVGLCGFGLWAGLFVGEVRETHRVVWEVFMGNRPTPECLVPSEAIAQLGGADRTARRLSTYLRLPCWAAPEKEKAVQLLGYCGKPAFPALSRILRGKDAELCRSAAWQLVRISRNGAADAIQVLVGALGHPNARVRVEAAACLAYYGEKACKATPRLIEMLGDPNRDVQLRAARTLGSIGPAAAETVPALEKAFQGKDKGVRAVVAEALKNIRGEK